MNKEAHMMDPTMLLLVLMMGALPMQGLDASASRSTARIDHRQATQQQRINHDVASGELTRKEADRLRREQARIQKAENDALADGRLTRNERVRIEKMQDRAGAYISTQKHDRQRTH